LSGFGRDHFSLALLTATLLQITHAKNNSNNNNNKKVRKEKKA